MVIMKYEIKKFDGSNDFSPLKRKMKNILIQQELDAALKEDFVVDVKEEVKKTKMKNKCSCIEL